jgi:hypothetical protein
MDQTMDHKLHILTPEELDALYGLSPEDRRLMDEALDHFHDEAEYERLMSQVRNVPSLEIYANFKTYMEEHGIYKCRLANAAGFTLLQSAVIELDVGMVMFLLSLGAEPDYAPRRRDVKHIHTPDTKYRKMSPRKLANDRSKLSIDVKLIHRQDEILRILKC